MYSIDAAAIARAGGTPAIRLLAVSPVVWWLGLTSLFTDISTEMVYSTLPAYLVLHLGFSPLAFGLVDGSYHGTTALLRVVTALFTDRVRRYKEVAALGYALSALGKVALLLGTSWGVIAASVATDRMGKGVRTAPRDALVTLSSPRPDLGAAFGVHRALDAVGAMLGPLVAFLVLSVTVDGFDVLFLTSLCAALVGLSAIGLFVHNPGAEDAGAARLTLARLAGAFRARPFARVAGATALLGVVTIGDGFLYLLIQRRIHLPASWFPLLAFGVAATYMLAAFPLGRLADRVGRGVVFVGGHVALAAIYLGLLIRPSMSVPVGVACLALLGLYYAATDGVLVALASARLDRDILTTGLAVIGTIASLSRLLASVAFGAVWSSAGETTAVGVFGAGLLLSTTVAAVATHRLRHA